MESIAKALPARRRFVAFFFAKSYAVGTDPRAVSSMMRPSERCRRTADMLETAATYCRLAPNNQGQNPDTL
jgi:hypothetical protein